MKRRCSSCCITTDCGMGIDVTRFVEPVDDEFKCCICLNVLEKPVHGTCGHVFCRSCITTWLESGPPLRHSASGRRVLRFVGSCPVDRKVLHQDDLIEAALPFRALLSRLRIKCQYAEFGCPQVVAVAGHADHVKVCNFNPDELVECRNGCAKFYTRKQLVKSKHNCIKELQSLIQTQEQLISDLESDRTAYQKSCQNQNYIIIVLVAILFGLFMTTFVPDTQRQ